MHRSFKELQLEINENATPYEPYKPINPPAPKGIIMDGATNYVQLPSMTMDSVEIDCLIDSAQPNASHYLLDARNLGGVGGWFAEAAPNIGPNVTRILIDGIEKPMLFSNVPKNKRTKVVTVFASSFVDDVTIFSRYSVSSFAKGILYGVKCYLNGKVVAEYDFTTENTKAMNVVMGTKTWRNKLAKR